MPDVNTWSPNDEAYKEERQSELAERQCEHIFVQVIAVAFGVWFGLIGSHFERIMEFLIIAVLIGFMIFAIGKLGSEEVLVQSTKYFFIACLSFSFTVLASHYLRLKVEPPQKVTTTDI